MNYIGRDIEEFLKEPTHKATVIFGARRVGKTTLLRHLIGEKNVRWYNADLSADVKSLNLQSCGDVRAALTQADVLVIDEAQRIPSIGLTLKILVDANEMLEKPTQIYVSGSSSFELAQGVKESAVGRLRTYQLWPFSLPEIAQHRGWGYVTQHIDDFLLYGCYPNAFENPDAAVMLRDLAEGLLYKDIFSLTGIRRSSSFEHLVKLLANSVGSEVNYDSLSRDTGLNKTTVAKYIDFLEQAYIVKVCPSFSKNLANELRKGKKIYFCDNGIRNALIDDFRPLNERSDKGALWENLFYMERLKKHTLEKQNVKLYFWRTSGSSPQEIDFIEVLGDKIRAFECKSTKQKKSSSFEHFMKAYPQSSIKTVLPSEIECIRL